MWTRSFTLLINDNPRPWDQQSVAPGFNSNKLCSIRLARDACGSWPRISTYAGGGRRFNRIIPLHFTLAGAIRIVYRVGGFCNTRHSRREPEIVADADTTQATNDVMPAPPQCQPSSALSISTQSVYRR